MQPNAEFLPIFHCELFTADLSASEPDQGRMADLVRRQSEKVADHNVSHQHGIAPFAWLKRAEPFLFRDLIINQ